MKITRIRKLAVGAVAGVVFLFFVCNGCAPKRKIRTSDEMFNQNPMQRIAVFTAGKINWPRMGKGGQVLGLLDSKEALEQHLEKGEQILSKKGYEIVAAKSVGIGYCSNNWWLMPEKYGVDDSCQLEKIESSKPVFVYPEFQNDDKSTKAIHALFEQLGQAIIGKRLDSFAPSKEDIIIIQQNTMADTICLNRVYGLKYSSRRKAGAFALGVVAAMFGAYGGTNISDMVESYFVFIDATTGNILWQHGLYFQGNPTEPSAKSIGNVLKFFPARGEPFDQKNCAWKEDGFAYCK